MFYDLMRNFFCVILGFAPIWHYRPHKELISVKNIDTMTIDKIHLKCDCIYDSILNGVG